MFYGRDDVMNDLMALWGKKVSSLITCRGRRRIGKVEALSRPKGKTIRTALVYDGELAQTVEASGYFNALVNIREILL